MSYAPIYAKLRDLEERLIKVESAPSSISLPHPVVSSSSTISDTVIDNSSDLTKLLNDCALNSSSITQLSNTIAMLATKDELVPLATKDELVPLATKDELVPLATKDELVPLATKDELVPLATKDELVPLATKDELVSKDELANLFVKFDNIINVVAQLNTRIDELYTKIQ
jgi:DNA polymerase gamma 1